MSEAFYVAAHVAVALLYLWLARSVWTDLDRERGATARTPAWAVPLAIALHGTLLGWSLFGDEPFRFGFALALSATFWLTVAIVWAEGFFISLRGLYPLVLPLAAVSALLPALFPGSVVAVASGKLALRVHLLVALLSYSLLTIAALHALLMAALDRQLHAATRDGGGSRLFRHVPPLLAMEKLLFQLIGIGFLLLTATVLSGVVFSEYLFGRALRFEHKTVWSIAAWLVFGGLLVGRHFFGWRGRVALRWTLAGFVMLLLAYVGSRFVLEVILQRL
ncbi:MAG: inner membrane protein YpjD [Betaproteobacteria bacterium]